jgi:hypothetical protein
MEVDMRYRAFVSGSTVAVVLAVWALVPVPLTGQTQAVPPKTTTKSGPPPRTPWGKPDLQGTWDFRTVTPLERPAELAGKEVLTAAEAAEFEKGALVRADRDRNVPAGNVGDYNQFWYDRGTEVAGTRRTSLIIDPPDGRIPALTPEAQKKKAAEAEARRGVDLDTPTPGGWLHDLGPGGLRVRCILGFNSGPPMTPSAYNNNVQLFQTPDYVVILNEMIHDARIVPLDGRPHGTLRQWAGNSRGRWEGDTLIVDTVNFRAAPLMTTSEFSANMHLVERFRRIDADTLMYEFTVEDPTTWTRPWTGQVPMKRSDDSIYEYACHEGNYSVNNILAGARAKEAAEESSKKGLR